MGVTTMSEGPGTPPYDPEGEGTDGSEDYKS